MIKPMTEETFACPASFAQERLWFLAQMDPGDPAYNIAGAVRFTGILDVNALRASLNEVGRRHESLRTTFKLAGGSVIQIVSPEAAIGLDMVAIDMSDGDGAARDFADQLSEIARQPFDLEAGPLLRITLLRSAPDNHTLLLVIHHIIADGWSLMVLIREVMSLYKAFVEGVPFNLPLLPIQYADYAHWQRKRLSRPSFQNAVEYWKQKLANLPATIFPADYTRPRVQKHIGARRSLQLSQAVSEDLLDLCQREQTTLFMVLLAAFKALVHRHTGSDEVIIGTPVAGRTRVELEPLVGCFVNTVVLRTQIQEETSFLSLLKQVRGVALEAYSHEDVPFEKVLEAINPERTWSQSPLFHVFFNMLSFPEALEIELPGVRAEMLEVRADSSKFDFTLYVTQKKRSITFDLVYDTELFAPERMAEVLGQYESLLAQVSRQPHKEIHSFSLVTREARLLLPDATAPLNSEWRGSVPDLFRAQVESGPDRVAVADPQVTWTYRQFDVLSSKIANYLINVGARGRDVVAIYAHRSAPLVPALLGIMKTGAAFLILDPAYPPARLVDYLRIARPKAILHLQAAGALPDAIEEFQRDSACLVLSLPSGGNGNFEDSLKNFSDVDPAVPLAAESLAYLAFTSGSTGKPKAVLGGHGALSHFGPWIAEKFRLTHSDRFSLLSGLAHDPLHRDVFLALMTGAAVFIPDADDWKLPGKAIQWVRENQISVMNLTPAIGQLIRSDVSSLGPPLDSLRYIFFVGDALSREDVSAFQKLAPGVTCVNLYGATETQQALSYHAVAPRPLEFARESEIPMLGKQKLPLGQGFKDVQLLVLNKSRNLCGIGEVGEIYFRSPYLALGYLDEPELSAQKFAHNWASSGPGNPAINNDRDRLYRTGDLGRYLPGGEVESLGRTDCQVKIRGFRVELEEIEAVLKQHPEVRLAAVIAREEEDGTRYLTAYVAPTNEKQSWENELFNFVAERLPSYMVPAAIVSLDVLPLLPTGKIDRRALAALPSPRIEATLQRRPQEVDDGDEEILAGIFADVLKRKHVAADDNFFEAGGHSLLTVQVLARVRDIYAVELTQRTFFDSPTAAGLARHVRAARRTDPDVPAIKKARRDQVLPLSFAQQRLWFLERLQPGSTAYSMLFGIWLSGTLDKEAFHRSLREIVRRHEVLRTTFHEKNGVPEQKIKDHIELPIDEIDLRHLSVENKERELQRERSAESERPFDLQTGPLLRVKLIQLDDREHAVLMTMHHIVGDAWSTGVVIQELSQLYAAYAAGKPPSLAPLAIQYADYAVWQREWLQGDALEKQLGYWRKQLAGVATLELPLDRQRPALMSQHAAVLSVHLNSGLSEELKQLARREGATLFMVLLAAWQLLMSRYSGQEDIAIGAPIAGRTRTEASVLIGFFVNTLVLRTRVSQQSSFRELLRQVRQLSLEAYDHQDVPFEKLVEELHPERDLSRQPFFQVMLGLQNTARQELQLPGLHLTALKQEEDSVATKFDLTLLVAESEQGIQGRLEYVPALFNKSTAETLIRRWELVLEQVATDARRVVAHVSLMTASERAQLAMGWSGPVVENGVEQTIGALVASHARHRPEALALAEVRRELTYDDLNRQANQWAYYFIGQGIRTGSRVIVCVEQMAQLLPVSLGVMKCGGVLVGLDPDEPPARMTLIVESARAVAMITAKHLAMHIPPGEMRFIYVDECGADVSGQSESNLEVEVRVDDPACVLYRSSAIGRPLGVVIRHRALWSQEFAPTPGGLEVNESDRVALTFAFAQEAASLQMLRTIARGACLISLPVNPPLAPRKMVSLLRDQRVSILWTSKSVLERMGREFPLALKSVRRIMCEQSPASLMQMRDTLSPEVLERVYGICACSEAGGVWMVFPAGSMGPGGAVRMGQLAAGSAIYLLDGELEPAAEGILGEIFVSGQSVALSYDQDAPGTATHFLPDPYSGLPSARMYRTGDLAWRRADGTLEFRGRYDGRTMLNGVRGHVEEIESALLHHPDVSEAVVVIRKRDSEAELVAMVVAANGREILATDLLRFLQAHLPAMMQPKSIIQLEKFPVFARGGVDRTALQKLAEEESGGVIAEYVAPRNLMEEQLAGIWAKIFGVEQVGIHDNFFRLGGHSLLATQVVAHINDALHVELPLRRLFEAPTVAELARVAEQLMAAGVSEQAPVIAKVSRDLPLPLSFAQQRLWFLDQLEPGSAAYNLRVAIRMIGELNREALAWSLQEIVRRHEALRTSFASREGNAVQVIALDLKLEIEEIDLRGNSAEQRESECKRLVREEAVTPFDLTRAPLLRVKLLRLEEQEGLLLATMHHIVSDGWSMGIMVTEFTRLYEAYVLGQPSPLPQLALQYADYAVWQRTWLQGEVLDRQIAYWRKQLADVSLLELPSDHPRPAAMSQRGASFPISISAGLTERLRALSQANGVTLFMTLLASFQLLLSRYSGQSDVTVGTPIAGRTRTDTEGLIGFFINTLVLRSTINERSTFQQLLAHVRERTLEAYEHQDVPFEKLVDELQPERDLSRQPFFQVMFALQKATEAELQLPGLRLAPMQSGDETQTSKFDMLLLLEEGSRGIQGPLEYTPDLFDQSTIETMVRRWLLILEQVVQNAAKPVSQISILRDNERQALARGWSGPEKTDRRDHVCALIARHAEQRPQATALVTEGQELTWRALDRKSNQWGHYLLKQGISRGVPVAVCLSNAADLVITSIGVLKCGGVLVGLDPQEPATRLGLMLQNSRAVLVITEKPQSEGFFTDSVPLLMIDEHRVEVAKQSEEVPPVEIDASSLAWILYRSSPVGCPIGIMLTHRTVSGDSFAGAPGISESDRVALPIGFSADMAAIELFHTLASGASVVNVPMRQVAAPRKFANFIREQKISVLWTSASILERLAREFPAAIRTVRQIVCQEDNSVLNWLQQMLSREVLDRVRGVYGSVEAGGKWMAYPPTSLSGETLTVIKEDQFPARTKVYLLDTDLELTPDGVVGEIHVGGDSLALGYQLEPQLTAELFVPDPFSGVSGGRLCRTGERARRRSGGGLEYCGRRDGQMIVGGVRVAAEELETILAQSPAVREAAIVMHSSSGQQNAVIVAAVTTADGQNLSTESLPGFVRGKVPEFMVPGSFVQVERIPRNADGGIDRPAVVRMLQTRDAAIAAPEYEAPRNEVEKILTGVWEEVLSVTRVGVHDNFFKLGGDSILSIQVIARARQAGIGLMPRQIFEKQTIAELAAVADSVSTTVAEQGVITGQVLLSPFQKEFFQWELDRPNYFNQSILLRLDARADTSLMEHAMSALVKQHDALRMKFERVEHGWQQTCEADPAEGMYERRSLTALSGSERVAELERDATRTQGSLDLAAGRLIKAVEYDLGAEAGKRLLLVIHHLVVDGVSWRILVDDLERGYKQLAEGKEIALGPKTTSFKQWTERLEQYAEDDGVKREIEYWTGQSRKKAGRVPLDFAENRNKNVFGTQKSVVGYLTEEETRALLQDVPSVYNTQINDVLLTALGKVLGPWIGSEAVVIDLEGHGREEIFPDLDVSRTVGWFTSTYPIVLETGPGPGWQPGKVLSRVKEQLRSIPNRGLGYGVLRHVSKDGRIRSRLSELPAAEIIFNYLGQVDQVLRKSTLLASAPETSGTAVALENRRPYVLDVSGLVVKSRLQVNWSYSDQLHRRERIEEVATRYMERLRELIDHCRSEGAGGFTPSDFPVAEMTQKEFMQIASLLGK
jgi:amino acid adenylation domain-containing protein/non-ribosomal peptide synthase protein (TIGR01720 family)